MTRLTCLFVGVCLIGCSGGGAADAEPIDAEPPGGTLTLAWTLEDLQAAPIACADVSALTVTVTASPTIGGASLPFPFLCPSGSGTTGPIPPGNYAIRAELRAGAGRLAPVRTFPAQDIQFSTDIDLGTVVFTVATTGGFQLRIDSDASGTNCGTDSPNAGITGTLLELLDSNGVCVATTFEIAAGANDAAFSYVTTCPAGPVTTCIENDQDISIASLPAGDYSVRIVGAETTFDCYLTTATLTVPGGDLIADIGTVTMPLDDTNTDCVSP